jgi:hypothetical protein
MKAVIDRFEAEFAVLIVGEDERRMNVLRKLLPKRAKEGQWLQVEILNDQVLNVAIDEQETELARQRIADKLAALRRGDHLK